MFFVLGALLAGLLGLMILPALWRRAVRLSTRRLEMQTPLSMDEVLADRDLLRAEHAVAQCRLEERLARQQEAHTRDRADLGRNLAARAAQAEIMNELRADHARMQMEHDDALAQAVDMHAQLGAAMIEAQGGYSASEASEARVLETRREVAEREQQLVARQAMVERLTEERDRARAEVARYTDRHLRLRHEIEARERRIGELDKALAVANRKLAAAERKRGSASLAQDDASLRLSIADLGTEVQRIAQALEGRPAQAQPGTTQRAGKGARAAVE